MIRILLLLPLISERSGYLLDLMSRIREQTIARANPAVSLAIGCAALIIVFKMIWLSYDIMSDEQSAGFGGVRLWTIIRPVIIFFLIQSTSFWVPLFDNGIDAITVAISKTVDAQAVAKETAQLICKDEAAADALSSDAVTAAMAKGSASYQAVRTAMSHSSGLLSALFMLGDKFDFHPVEKGMEKHEVAKVLEEACKSNGVPINSTVINKRVTDFINASSYVDNLQGNGVYEVNILKPKNLIPSICFWLYDRLYIVVQCVAEIILTLLAIFAPWSLVMSLTEPWKGSFVSFLTAYIQVSFWKVVAAIINMATLRFRAGVINLCMSDSFTNLCKTAAGSDISAMGATGAAIILSAIMSIAGVFCLLKISDLTAQLIPSASSIGAASGGAATAKQAAEVPVNAAKKAVGGAISIGTMIATGGAASAPSAAISATKQRKQQNQQHQEILSAIKESKR